MSKRRRHVIAERSMMALGVAVLLLLLSAWSPGTEAVGSRRRSLLGLLSGRPEAGAASAYSYETAYFPQILDHFVAAESRSFQQRYLVNRQWWKSGGPIFFYTGNEGDITWFCNNTGFVWDIAPHYGAMVVFAEHRYYGESLPFGNDSYKDAAHLSYLTSEQALADFAVLATALRNSIYKTPSSPLIAFGGSYGGMLAAWFRMKYPAIVQGSIAASAPIWWFQGLTPCDSAYLTITRDFSSVNPNCSDNIARSWAAIDRVAKSDLDWIRTTFKLCSPLTSTSVDSFKSWIVDTFFNLAMVDYPYPANFLAPLPAWPINKTCEALATKITEDQELLTALALSLQVYYNSTGSAECFNTSQDATSSLGERGWDFQACTEMVMPMCSEPGPNNMFLAMPWDFAAYSENCYLQFGVTPQEYLVEMEYGGKNISAISNIVFRYKYSRQTNLS
jgi:lysosomal Pro-X carboxypeptidase